MTNPLLGKTIVGIDLADDKKAIRFRLLEGEPIIAHADGDCCSVTWIENIEGANDVLGSPVLSAKDINMPEQDYDASQYEVLAFYGFEIRTARGVCTIDYRNDSNGYYGGDLTWPDEHFYGGVHGQNVSTLKWVPVAEEINL